MSDREGVRYLHTVDPGQPVWVDLRRVFPIGGPKETVPDGLDLTGLVPGTLSAWIATTTGHWVGFVTFMLGTPGAGGTTHRQWILADALRPRTEAPTRP